MAEFNDLERAIILIREAQESGEWERLTHDPAHQQRMAALAAERGWGMGMLEARAWEMYGDGYEAGMKDASVQAEAEDSGIAHDYRDVLTGIQEFFDVRPEVRRSFGGGTMVDKNLIAYATRLEEENHALQAANRRLQDKLAEEARLHREQGAEIDQLKKQNSALSNALVNSSRVYDKLYRKFGKLADAASDVYDFHFDDDHSVFLRRLRRVMKACGIYFCRK